MEEGCDILTERAVICSICKQLPAAIGGVWFEVMGLPLLTTKSEVLGYPTIFRELGFR